MHFRSYAYVELFQKAFMHEYYGYRVTDDTSRNESLQGRLRLCPKRTIFFKNRAIYETSRTVFKRW